MIDLGFKGKFKTYWTLTYIKLGCNRGYAHKYLTISDDEMVLLFFFFFLRGEMVLCKWVSQSSWFFMLCAEEKKLRRPSHINYISFKKGIIDETDKHHNGRQKIIEYSMSAINVYSSLSHEL